MTSSRKKTLLTAAFTLVATPVLAGDAISSKMDTDNAAPLYAVSSYDVISEKMNSDANATRYSVAMGTAAYVVDTKMSNDAAAPKIAFAANPAAGAISAKMDADNTLPVRVTLGAIDAKMDADYAAAAADPTRCEPGTACF